MKITPEAILNAPRKKVFCRDCKYFRSAFILEHCAHPSNVIEKVTHLGIEKHTISHPSEKNINNECRTFKKIPLFERTDNVAILSKVLVITAAIFFVVTLLRAVLIK